MSDMLTQTTQQFRHTCLGILVLLLAPLGARADDVPVDELLTKGKSLYSQEKQELIIRHFFGDRRDGFFVDVGCFHWKDASTTFYLEEHLGWSGIGIDAQEIYRAGWKEHRPRSKFFAYAVTDKSGETITFFQAGGLSSTETTNIKKWQKKIDFEPVETVVPTITLNDLLDREGVKKIDFLSIDINGGETIALKGFDIQRFRPELVHVEASPHRKAALSEYFERNGYQRIDAYLKYDATNWYFTPKTPESPKGS